jgi:hypothetical protein
MSARPSSRRFSLPRLSRLSLLIAVYAIGLMSIPAAPVDALQATRSAAYDAFDVTIEVRDDGSFRVTETMTVDFEIGSFSHGFRWIPTEQSGGIAIVSVEEEIDGELVPYQEVAPDELGEFVGNELIDWDVTGVPRYSAKPALDEIESIQVDWIFPEFVDGPETRTFILTYDVADALLVYPDADPPYQEVWWTAIGEELSEGAPIRSGSVEVILPEAVPLDQVQAASNADENDPAELSDDGQRFVWTFGEIDRGDPFAIRLQFPPVADNAAVPAWQADYDQEVAQQARTEDRNAVIRLVLAMAGLGIAVGGGLLLYGWWYLRGRDPNPGLAAVGIATEPPSDLPAAVAGVLVDEVVDERDLVAILFDLQQRGAVEISQPQDAKPRPVSSSSRDFIFTLKDPDVPLPHHERIVLRSLFGYQAKPGTRASFRNQRRALQASWPEVTEALYSELVQQNLMPKSPALTRRGWRIGGAVVVGLAIVFGIGGLILSQPMALFPAIAGTGIGIAMVYFSRAMPQKTRVGAEAAAQWRAFAEHLRSLTLYKGVNEGRETLARYLPYTIALGIDKEWIPRLEQASAAGWTDVITQRLDTGEWSGIPTGGGWFGDLFSGSGGGRWSEGDYRRVGGGGTPNLDLPNLPNAPNLPNFPSGGLQDLSGGASKGLNIASDDAAKLFMDVAGILLKVGLSALSGGKGGGGGGGGGGFN